MSSAFDSEERDPSTSRQGGIGIDLLLSLLFSFNLIFELPLKRFAYFVPLWETYPALLYLLVLVFAAWFFFASRWRGAVSSEHSRVRLGFAGFVLLFTIVLGTFVQIGIRHQTDAPERAIHDGAMQTEASIALLRSGENPYRANFQETTFGRYLDVFSGGTLPNPAWEHYVYPPGYLLVSTPFAALSDFLGIAYDQRIVHLAFLFLALGLLAFGLPPSRRALGWVLFALNPLFVWYFMAGYNDIAVLTALLAVAVLWQKQRIFWALFALGIAVTFKQFALFFVPAFFFVLFFSHRKRFVRGVLVFLVPLVLLYGPFLIADAPALVDDLVRFPSAGGLRSYPISGFGFSKVLLDLGVIADARDAYPFWIFQLVVLVPLLVAGYRILRKHQSIATIFLVSTLLTAAFWFFGRYLNDSHIVFFVELVILAWLFSGSQREAYA